MGTNIETGIEKEFSTREELNELRKKIEKPSNNPEITKREGKLAYCRVLQGDTIPKIKKRLVKYPEFSYLNDSIYDEKIHGFNINPQHLKAGMDLMIPLKLESRQIENSVFVKSCKKAINNMKSNSIYGKRVTDLTNSIGENKLAHVMSAFAKTETTDGKPDVKIGNGSLYRYENTNTYSISYYHIIMKRGGLTALNNLNMSQGDTCDPTNAGMLFLAYWCENESYIKSKYKWSLEDCLNPGKKNWHTRAAKVYNSGSNSYSGMLKENYDNLKRIG